MGAWGLRALGRRDHGCEATVDNQKLIRSADAFGMMPDTVTLLLMPAKAFLPVPLIRKW